MRPIVALLATAASGCFSAVAAATASCGWPLRAQNDMFTSESRAAGIKSVKSVDFTASANNQILNTPLVFNASGQSVALVGSSDSVIRLYDASSGSTKWSFQAGAEITSTCSLATVGSDTLVICPTRAMKTFAFDAAVIASNPTAAPLWEYAGQAVFDVAAPLVCPTQSVSTDKVVWLVTLDGYMHAVSAVSGKRLWRGLIDTTQTTDTGVHPVALDATCSRFAAAANTVGTPTSGGHWRGSTVAFFSWDGKGTADSAGALATISAPVVSASLSSDIGQVQAVMVAPRDSSGTAPTVFLATRSEQSINSGRLYAVNTTSGAVLWMTEHSIFFSSPAYHTPSNGLVIFGDTFVSTVQAELKVLFVDAATGDVRSTVADADSKWNPTQYDVGPTISDSDQAIVPSSGGKLVFLKLTSANARWTMAEQFTYALSAPDDNNPLTSSAVLLQGGRVLAATANGKLNMLSGEAEACAAGRCVCGGSGAGGSGGDSAAAVHSALLGIFAAITLATGMQYVCS